MKKIFHISIIGSSGYGASVQLGLWNGTFTGQQLLYYTILSNLLIFGYYSYLLIKGVTKGAKYNNNIHAAFTLMIIITGLIYHLILVPQLQEINPYGIDPLANTLVHTYTPLAVFIDWVCFVIIKDTQKLTPLYWLSIPLSYWLLSLIYASFKIPFSLTGNYYAYSFIDINLLGLKTVILNIILCFFVFLLLGYFLKLIKQFQNAIYSKLGKL